MSARLQPALDRLRDYLSDYEFNAGFANYADETFINDVIYGLGLALDPDAHKFATGFDVFKQRIGWRQLVIGEPAERDRSGDVRPADGQCVVYYFAPSGYWHTGVYNMYSDVVSGSSNFTSWQPEVTKWFPQKGPKP